ncbi:hypothetical protein BDV12DRAFT_145752 [Aspergillus spectabilis]
MMDSYAHQACTRCRTQKRRCSRLLPVCVRCKRLNLRCHYPGYSSSESPPMANVTQSPLAALGHSLQSQVFSTIGDAISISQSAAAYFSTVHVWFPTLDRGVYSRRLPELHVDPLPGFSLLTLCIYLIGLPPLEDGFSNHMNALYIQLAGCVASLTAVGVHSLDLLHSRLLLSLFEVGHGMYPVADISMGANARAAEAMGVYLPSDQLYDQLGSVEAAEDARRIWQGMLILDRCIALEMGKPPTIPPSPRPEQTRAMSPQITPNAAESTQLTRLLLASTHLTQVLSHVHIRTSSQQKSAEAMRIVESLASFRDTLAQSNETSLAYPAAPLCSR